MWQSERADAPQFGGPQRGRLGLLPRRLVHCPASVRDRGKRRGRVCQQVLHRFPDDAKIFDLWSATLSAPSSRSAGHTQGGRSIQVGCCRSPPVLPNDSTYDAPGDRCSAVLRCVFSAIASVRVPVLYALTRSASLRNRKRQHAGDTTEPDRWGGDDLPSVRPYLDGSRQSLSATSRLSVAVVFSDSGVNRALRGVKLARASSRSSADLIVSTLAAPPVSS